MMLALPTFFTKQPDDQKPTLKRLEKRGRIRKEEEEEEEEDMGAFFIVSFLFFLSFYL